MTNVAATGEALMEGGRAMFTTILAYVTAIAGLVMIAAGAWGGFAVFVESGRLPIPRRYYAFAIAMIGTGVGLIAIAQALRLLLLIYRTSGHF